MRYDAIIVGNGPAGLSAALNLTARSKRFLLFGQSAASKKVYTAQKVDNYLGLPAISGEELSHSFDRHMQDMGIELTQGQVGTVFSMGDYFSVAVGTELFEATAVIIAAGVFSAKLLPGEEALLGRGVSYYVTCDAPLYKGKTAAVIGHGEEAVREANYLATVAGKVYYIPIGKLPFEPDSGIEIVRDGPTGISGDHGDYALALKSGGQLAVDGVFILRESIAPATLAPGLEMRDGFIAVDAEMRTNIPGLFAAGDCTGRPHQYMRAAGQGQTAALCAVTYIDTLLRDKKEELKK